MHPGNFFRYDHNPEHCRLFPWGMRFQAHHVFSSHIFTVKKTWGMKLDMIVLFMEAEVLVKSCKYPSGGGGLGGGGVPLGIVTVSGDVLGRP
jgi:hypothetical protein